jgi:hypothetical protein
LSVQRQAIEHLFEIYFGTESLRSIPLPGARIPHIFSCPSGDFHRKLWAARKNQPSSIAMSTKEVTMSFATNDVPDLIHTDAVLDATRLRVAGRLLPRGANASDEGQKAEAMTPEPFVSAEQAAQFLSIKRRYLLALARKGIAGAYALGTGTVRKIWVFRLSELAAAVARNADPQNAGNVRSSGSGSPR